jgi:NAD(P) transhydrogenase subunit alpha
MIVGVVKETFPGERRVALVPAILPSLSKAGIEVLIEPDAGREAGFTDAAYQEKGAKVASSRDEVFSQAEAILQVRSLGANPEGYRADLEKMRADQMLVGNTESLGEPGPTADAAKAGVTAFSMELIPRITRAQSMDVLSSMATIAGYKAVLLAAAQLPRMFPMMMTAAGSLTPAKVFIIGAGVAGLQAIASSKRLGAKVEAYDVRPAVKEQVESVGAKFVELELETGEAEDKGGYAKEMGDEFIRKQRELMGRVVAANDVVITTAAIPGKKAPLLLTQAMVEGMQPGSVIVDLAAERGGNCELTRAGEPVVHNDVTILGPVNIPSTVPYHASQMYSKNITTFLLSMVKEGAVTLDLEDEVVRDTLVARGGEVVNPRVREALGQSGPAGQ